MTEQWVCTTCGEIQAPLRRCAKCGERRDTTVAPAASQPRPSIGDAGLPRVDSDPLSRLHFLGVHGGAGESTLAALFPGAVEAHGAWPVEAIVDGQPAHPTPVVLVARTHVHGLTAAHNALLEWKAGAVDPIEVTGLILVADIPGRPPARIRQMMRDLKAAAPRSAELPYVSRLRTDPSALSRQGDASLNRLREQVAQFAGNSARSW